MICFDASLAVKWLLDEDDSERAKSLYRSTIEADELIIAPPLLPIEITNILRQRMRASNDFTLQEATSLLEGFLTLPIEIHNPVGLHSLALALSEAHGLPAAYDAHYLALARLYDCEFWTADQRLLQRLAGSIASVRSLNEYSEVERNGA